MNSTCARLAFIFIFNLVAFRAAGAEADVNPQTNLENRSSEIAHCPFSRFCWEVCLNFEQPPLGQIWGSPLNVPGDLVYFESGIYTTVEPFVLGSFSAFHWARVEAQPKVSGWSIGSGQIVRMNNVDLTFDFSGLPFVPDSVRIEFLDLGGAENIRVDGSWLIQGDSGPAASGRVGVLDAAAPADQRQEGHRQGRRSTHAADHRGPGALDRPGLRHAPGRGAVTLHLSFRFVEV